MRKHEPYEDAQGMESIGTKPTKKQGSLDAGKEMKGMASKDEGGREGGRRSVDEGQARTDTGWKERKKRRTEERETHPHTQEIETEIEVERETKGTARQRQRGPNARCSLCSRRNNILVSNHAVGAFTS